MKEYDKFKGYGHLSIPFNEVIVRQKEGEEIKSTKNIKAGGYISAPALL
jgi:hypothetical protein